MQNPLMSVQGEMVPFAALFASLDMLLVVEFYSVELHPYFAVEFSDELFGGWASVYICCRRYCSLFILMCILFGSTPF